MPDAEQDGDQTDSPANREEAPGASDTKSEDRWTEINDLVKDLIRRNAERDQQPRDVWYFLSSGVFFMIVGAAALFAAFLTMNTTHASFTFMLVVIGVAILLYGTGTQGAGNFESAAGEMRYKIGVAGGAGLLAFAVAMGIVWKADSIREAFQIERKYAKLFFRDKGDGVGSLADYVPEVLVDGVPVPVQRSGDMIVAYIPYVAQQNDKSMLITARFYYVGSEQARNRLLASVVSLNQSYPFKLGEITSDDAGFDFPRLGRDDVIVNLINESAGNDPDEIAAIDHPPIDKKPPPLDSGGFQ